MPRSSVTFFPVFPKPAVVPFSYLCRPSPMLPDISTGHSIIQAIEPEWFNLGRVKVFIKRDDLIHPIISGNKWRKLKYNLAEALKNDQLHLLTFGGAFSNHLLAVACAGAIMKIPTTGIVRGERPPDHNHVIMLCEMYGMKLHFIGREVYRDKNRYLADHFPGTNHYLIPEGGSNRFAVKGVAELFTELNTSYDFIYTACGTGGTTAGLLYGAEEKKLDTRVRCVAVLKGGGFLEADIQALGVPTLKLELLTDRHHGGYGDYTPELIAFMKRFAAATGILLDPVYTGKMMYALWQDIRSGAVPAGSSVLALHTGGITGLYSRRFTEAFA